MKELEISIKDKLELKAETPVKSERKFLGSVVPKRGHSCFEINLKTGEVCLAEFESSDAIFPLDGEVVRTSKVVVRRENCVYVTALNKKNAEKKVKQTLIKGM